MSPPTTRASATSRPSAPAFGTPASLNCFAMAWAVLTGMLSRVMVATPSAVRISMVKDAPGSCR